MWRAVGVATGCVVHVQPFVGAFSWAVYTGSVQDKVAGTQASVTSTPKKK